MATNNSINVGTATAGKVLQAAGAGVAPTYSTPTYPSSSGTSRKILVSDGTNNVYSTETWAVPGTSGNILTSDGTNWTSAANSAAFTPNSVINIYEEFFGQFTSSVYTGQTCWQSNSNTTAPFAPLTTTSSAHPGVLQCNSITSGLGFGQISLGQPTAATALHIILGGGAISLNWIINVATLSTVTNTYTLYAGMAKGQAAQAEPTDGVYFAYTNALNSGNWVGKTANASSRSSANSSTAVSAGSWVNLGITINAAATSIGYFVNGSQIANSPIATNIPTAAIVPFLSIVQSNGTPPSGAVLIDAFYMTQTLSTPR